ncbi:YlqD family protein [Oceanobacillus luteolus]|nr:YlqD family protein [Oceanobacillus luteolus]
MKIIKKVEIKQVITEQSKAKIKSNFFEQKMRLEQECQQLLFEKRKMLNKKGVPKQEIELRFQKEISKRKDEIELITFKEEQLEILEDGSEIVEGEVESLVEVSIGANWEQLMKRQAIVIKDDIVVRIDE